ncbi:MAG: FHA domain-containing protein [Myxococcaceae bacterium]
MGSGLSQFAQRYLVGGEKARKELDRPVLVWEAPSDDEDAGNRWHHTKITGQTTTTAKPAVSEPLVYEIKKAVGKVNAFAQGVTVGRSDSNDVVLADTSVSRFHAYFQKDRKTERWTVVDAESKFGTLVDGLKIPPNEPTFLNDRVKISFGQVVVTYFLPASFFQFMEHKARG